MIKKGLLDNMKFYLNDLRSEDSIDTWWPELRSYTNDEIAKLVDENYRGGLRMFILDYIVYMGDDERV